MGACSFFHDFEGRVVLSERFVDFDLVSSLVHPGGDRLIVGFHFRFPLFIRLSQQLLVNDFALELSIGVGLFESVIDFEVVHLVGQHFFDVEGVMAQVGLLLVGFEQFKDETDLCREGDPQSFVAEVG